MLLSILGHMLSIREGQVLQMGSRTHMPTLRDSWWHKEVAIGQWTPKYLLQ
jgi:hypothetical protein